MLEPYEVSFHLQDNMLEPYRVSSPILQPPAWYYQSNPYNEYCLRSQFAQKGKASKMGCSPLLEHK